MGNGNEYLRVEDGSVNASDFTFLFSITNFKTRIKYVRINR